MNINLTAPVTLDTRVVANDLLNLGQRIAAGQSTFEWSDILLLINASEVVKELAKQIPGDPRTDLTSRVDAVDSALIRSYEELTEIADTAEDEKLAADLVSAHYAVMDAQAQTAEILDVLFQMDARGKRL